MGHGNKGVDMAYQNNSSSFDLSRDDSQKISVVDDTPPERQETDQVSNGKFKLEDLKIESRPTADENPTHTFGRLNEYEAKMGFKQQKTVTAEFTSKNS